MIFGFPEFLHFKGHNTQNSTWLSIHFVIKLLLIMQLQYQKHVVNNPRVSWAAMREVVKTNGNYWWRWLPCTKNPDQRHHVLRDDSLINAEADSEWSGERWNAQRSADIIILKDATREHELHLSEWTSFRHVLKFYFFSVSFHYLKLLMVSLWLRFN
jgi:hypothetical protein